MNPKINNIKEIDETKQKNENQKNGKIRIFLKISG